MRSPALVILIALIACRPAEEPPVSATDPSGGDTASSDGGQADGGSDSGAPTDSGSGDDSGPGDDSGAESPTENVPVRLNQLVTRLLLTEEVGADERWTITRERPGWLFVTATGCDGDGQGARIGVDVATADEAQLAVTAGAGTVEAMMEVAAGEHTVDIWLEGGCALDSAEVRAIPELRYDRYYPDNGLDADVVVGDADFLAEHAMPHLTTLVADWHWNAGALMKPWQAANRAWYTNSGNPYGTEAELIASYDYLVGVAASVDIGIDLDEFGGTDEAQWIAWTGALAATTAKYPDTPLGLYIGTRAAMDTDGQRDFVTAMLGLGHELLVEWYIGEQATEADLEAELEEMGAMVETYRTDFPGIEDQAVLVLSGASHSYVNFDWRPDVDFHVHLDRQFERIATDERFQDLHGLGFWTSSYMDEETIRWMMALYRHYGIEGATAPLSTDPYLLDHVQNPDFEAEDGWTLAASGQIGIGEYEWISEYEARWGAPDGVGDTYLYTTRGSGAAGTATQTITGLEPGRVYSLRYFTIWYENLYALRGVDYDYRRDHTVHATLAGAEVVAGSEIVVACDSTYPSTSQWVNQHRLRFVPEAETAVLTLSDWETETSAGGETWETHLFNFVQVQPYFEE